MLKTAYRTDAPFSQTEDPKIRPERADFPKSEPTHTEALTAVHHIQSAVMATPEAEAEVTPAAPFQAVEITETEAPPQGIPEL